MSLFVCSVCSVYDESVRYSRVSAVKHSTKREGESEKREKFVPPQRTSV